MVIIDEKSVHPPPPYASTAPSSHHLPPFPHRRTVASLVLLPSHLLLKVVYMTFSQSSALDQGRLERQRKTLYWISTSLRLVNRAFYVACMHVLRSTYLPVYESLIRSPYSSDPFPHDSAAETGSSPISTVQRETQVLDFFIALKVREDVWADDSELHLEREESFKDLFDLNQPRSRIEDLVRMYGMRERIISIPTASASASASSTPTSPSTPDSRSGSRLASSRASPRRPIPFSALSVSFSSRKVGLSLTSAGRKRTIVEVARLRDEKLEIAARKLVRELKSWLAASS